MCVLGCLDNDLTLLVAALQEIVKILGNIYMYYSYVAITHTLTPHTHTLHTSPTLYTSPSLCMHAHMHVHVESGVDLHLYSSCISALQAIALVLKDIPQV